MSGLMKVVLTVCGVLLVLTVAVSVFVKQELTPERIRASLIPLAEEQLQRKVEVGDIRIGLFSGVYLDKIRVLQRGSAAEFVSADALSLSYQFWPLLTGKIAIDEVRLVNPKIIVIRDADGNFNFSDLLHPAAEQSPSAATGETAPSRASADRSTGTAVAINLLVNQVAIVQGELQFIDQLQNPRSPYRYSLDQLNLQASKITLTESFPISFSAQLGDSKIDLNGNYHIGNHAGDFDLQLTPLDLVQFAPYYRDLLPGRLGSAALTLDLDVTLAGEKISSRGKISLDQLDVTLDDLPNAAFEQAMLNVAYSIIYQFDSRLLDISALLVDLNGIALGASGQVGLAGDEPEIAVDLQLDRFDLRKLSQGLPAKLVTELRTYSVAGLVDGKVVLAGNPGSGVKLLKSARFDLDQVNFSLADSRFGATGTIHYAGQAAQADNLLLNLGDQQLQLNFKLTELLGELIRGEFRIEADRLDLNPFLPVEVAEPVAGEGKPVQSDSSVDRANGFPPGDRSQVVAEEIGPFALPLEVTGSLFVKQLLYKQLTLERLQAELQLQQNRLRISDLRSQVAAGDVQAAAEVDLAVKGLAYSGNLAMDQVDLTALVSGLYPQARQSVSGRLQMQNNFSGRGTVPESLLQQLQLKGSVQVGQGKVTGSPLLGQVAGFLGSPELKVLSFRQFIGNYNLRDGVTRLTGDLDSSKVKLRPEGTVAVNGKLNLKLDTRLAPELLGTLGVKSDLKRALIDAEGWGVFPLKVEGTTAQPKVSFDSAQLKRQATDKAKQSITDQLMKKLGKKGVSDKEQQPIRQLLDGTLNKLFGK